MKPAPAAAAAPPPKVPPPGRVRLSSAALVGANLLPVWGALFWDWQVLSLLAIYWAENVVLGGITLLRMFVSPPYGILHGIGKLLTGAFFCFHYGMFCWVHGAILFAVFGSGGHATDADFLGLLDLLGSEPGLRASVALLVVSHGVSFVVNFLLGGEFRTTTSEMQMWRPYGRIVILHVVILAGGFIADATGSSIVALLMLAALKIRVDLWAHWREHRPKVSTIGA